MGRQTPAEIRIELPRKDQQAVILPPCAGPLTTATGGVTGDRSLANSVGACSPRDLHLGWWRLQPKRQTWHHLDAGMSQHKENQPFFLCEHVCENGAHEQSGVINVNVCASLTIPFVALYIGL